MGYRLCSPSVFFVVVNAEYVSDSIPKNKQFVTGEYYTSTSFALSGLTRVRSIYTTKNDCFLYCQAYGTHDNYGYFGFVNGAKVFAVAGDEGTDNIHSFSVPVKAGAVLGFQTGANVTISFSIIEYILS